jgi:glucuronosyltransferase
MQVGFLLVFVLYGGQGARILGLFPTPGKSHYFVSEALMKGLASRGHQVTVFSPFAEKSPIPNYTVIDTKTTRDYIMNQKGTTLNLFTRDVTELQIKMTANRTMLKHISVH